MPRPERPSKAKVDVVKAAAEISGETAPRGEKGPQARLSVRMHPDTYKAVRVAAVTADMTVEDYTLAALAAYGIQLHANDKGSKVPG